MKKYIGIVAKYKENIDWCSNYNCDFVIYNKDQDNMLDEHNYPNIGRESESYVRFILQNYNLLNQYKGVLFLQGNPFDHMHEEQLGAVLPNENGYVNHKSHLPIPLNFRWSYIFKEHNIISYSNHSEIYKYETPSDHLKHWQLTQQGMKFLNLPQYKYLIQQTGAQWFVPPKYILNKSFSWWENAHKMHYLNNELSMFSAYVFERLWENIWYHTDLEE